MRNSFFLIVVALILIGGCCKEKDTCKENKIMLNAFAERYYYFKCNNNDEYTFLFTKSSQIDSLQPTCFFLQPSAFPIDENGMRYILVGRLSYHNRDTFQTALSKDTCLKTVTYEVNMVQRDKAYSFPDSIGAIQSMYCAVENIPADYKVEVKYKYVPLP